MKNIQILNTVLLFLCVCVNSCSNSDDSLPIEEIDNGKIEIRINDILDVTLELVTTIELNNEITINGINCDPNVSISLTLPFKTGANIIDSIPEVYASYTSGEFWPCADDFFSANYTTFNAIDGSITISSITEEFVKGTFNFSAESFDSQTVSVTQGEFNVKRNDI
jgi:hypothetical protein